MLVKKVRELRE